MRSPQEAPVTGPQDAAGTIENRVELTDAERTVLLEPCVCGHTINDHGTLSPCWMCDEEGEGDCSTPFEALLVERIETIVQRDAKGLAALNALRSKENAAKVRIIGHGQKRHPETSALFAALAALLDPTERTET